MSLLTDHSYLIHKLRLAYPQGENITRVPKITQSKYYTPTKEGEEEQQQQQQQQQQPQYQRPIKQYQETGSILENTKNNYHEHHIIAPPKKNIQTIQSATNKVIPASREALTFEKQPNQQVEHKSRLTQKINEASQNLNTFAPFAKFSAKGDHSPIRLKLFFRNSDPLIIQIKRDATVYDVIGYALYEYIEQKAKPILPAGTHEVEAWDLRIVEEDGTLDEDFPALERTRKISKFAFDQFMICRTQMRKPRKPSNEAPHQVDTKPVNVLLKIHLYSTLEVKQTTTLDVPGDTLLTTILAMVCKKRKVDPSEYTLRLPDTRTDVDMDKTVDASGLREFCLLRKERGPSAGDIFLRPPDEVTDTDAPDAPRNMTEFSSQTYKKWIVNKRTPILVGRHERILAVDGDYVHIMPAGDKRFFDHIKTSSFHIAHLVSCHQLKKSPNTIRIITGSSDNPMKTYDLDCADSTEAEEIQSRLAFLMKTSQDVKPI